MASGAGGDYSDIYGDAGTETDIYANLYGDEEDDKPTSTATQPAASTTPAPAPAAPAPAPAAAQPTAAATAPIPSFSDTTMTPAAPAGGPGPAPLHFAPNYAAQRAQEGRTGGVRPADMPEEGKMFIGGLNWDTTDDTLKSYFEQFGKITHCTIMRDAESGRSRGFAFLTFEDPASVNAVMAREHHLDGKTIDPKRAIPRSDANKTDKLFVRALPAGCTQESFRAYWRAFGNITDATLMMDKETGRHRGFGFVNYEAKESVEKVLASGPHYMDGQMLEVKRAQAKGEPRRPDYGVNTNQGGAMGGGHLPYQPQPHFGGGAGVGVGGGVVNPALAAGGAGGVGGTPFDPAAMSKFFTQMGWGAWNPMMMAGMMGGAGGAPGMGLGGMGGMGGMGGLGGMGAFNPMMGMGGMGGFGAMPGMGMGMGGAGVGGEGGAVGGAEGSASPAGAAAGGGAGGQEVGTSQWTAPMAQPMAMRGGRGGGMGMGMRGGRGGGRPGFNPPTGPAAMRGGDESSGGAGPQRNRGGGAGFHPYSR